jgi:N-acetylglucosamine-6-phosphate deacetylase
MDNYDLIIKNGRLVNATHTEPVDFYVHSGKITRIAPNILIPGVEKIDATGCAIIPGLIDIHIQGAGGADVLDGTVEALQTISQTLARFGVTGFLATTFYNADRDNKHLRLAAEYCGKELGGARMLGIHIEGPFISPAKRGGIPEKCLTTPSQKALDDITHLCGSALKMMTIAPEIPGNDRIIKRLQEMNCIPSFGHSNANYEETLRGIEQGILHVTHLFNAMPGMNHRQPGPLLAIIENPLVTVQMIVDGVHIHPGVVRLMDRLLGVDRIIAITDAIQSMGLPDGRYIFHGHDYESKNGTARYADGTLIGTAMALDRMVSNYAHFTAAPFATAVKTATENPARLLGYAGSLGVIAENAGADFAILNEQGQIQQTFVGGVCVYSAD